MKYQAELWEFERGWGSRLDEIRDFETEEERNEFVTKFNSENNLDKTPDWYMIAKRRESK